jgi:hypothetical protein
MTANITVKLRKEGGDYFWEELLRFPRTEVRLTWSPSVDLGIGDARAQSPDLGGVRGCRLLASPDVWHSGGRGPIRREFAH